MPVTRNIGASANPDAIMRVDMIEKALHRRDPAGTSDQPAMKTNRHHLWRIRPFRVQGIERIP